VGTVESCLYGWRGYHERVQDREEDLERGQEVYSSEGVNEMVNLTELCSKIGFFKKINCFVCISLIL